MEYLSSKSKVNKTDKFLDSEYFLIEMFFTISTESKNIICKR